MVLPNLSRGAGLVALASTVLDPQTFSILAVPLKKNVKKKKTKTKYVNPPKGQLQITI